MKKIDFLHIYAGSSGTAGNYLREIYLALKENFSQEIIVNYYYPISYGKAKRIFYRFTELSSPYKYNYKLIRFCIRYLELVFSLIYSFYYVLFNKILFLNYNLTSDLFIEYIFLKLVNLTTGTKVLITCHDVIPFGTEDFSVLKKKIKKKRKFFLLADYLIIHNENSREELLEYYGISDNILEYPIPLMDLTDNFKDDIKKTNKITRFGMLGHIRNEKGLDILISAWSKFYSTDKHVELIIAGNLAIKDKDIINRITDKSIKVYPIFLSDDKFVQLIKELDFVVLPYKRGTNSGVALNVISFGTLLLTSDIPMFKNNLLIPPFFQFSSQDAISLAKKLNSLYSMSEEERLFHRINNINSIKNYRNSFIKIINQVYSNIKGNISHV